MSLIEQIYAEPKSLSVSQMVEEKYLAALPRLDAAQIAVMTDLRIASSPRNQEYLARSRPFLGAHPHWEHNKPTNETTHRRVRGIINELRVRHHIAILSDRRGYWLATSIEEAEAFLDEMERQARAAAKSYMVTFAAMKQAIQGLRPRDTVGLFDFNESVPVTSDEPDVQAGHLTGPIAPPPSHLD